ncbi:unnamed protein product [Brassica oleracea var. botrytis]
MASRFAFHQDSKAAVSLRYCDSPSMIDGRRREPCQGGGVIAVEVDPGRNTDAVPVQA